MDPALIASLIAAGVSLIGNISQNRRNDDTNAYNRELAEFQNTANIEQWNRENSYNQPSAQMQRFKEAGLNPNLIYGQTNLSANSPNLTSGAPATAVPPIMPNFADSSPLTLLREQKESIRLDNELKRKDLIQKDVDRETSEVQLTQSIEEFDKKLREYDDKHDIDVATANKLRQEFSNLKKSYEVLEGQLALLREQEKTESARAIEAAINAYYADERNRLELSKLRSSIGVDNATCKKLIQESLNLAVEGEAAKERLTALKAQVSADGKVHILSYGGKKYKMTTYQARAWNECIDYLSGSFDLNYFAEYQGLQVYKDIVGAILSGAGSGAARGAINKIKVK